MTFNNLSSNKLKYGIGSLFVILFAFVGVRLLNNGHAAPLYSKLIGINGTYSVDAYEKDAENMGVQWMRVEQWDDSTSYVPACQNSTQVSQATCGTPLVTSTLASHNIRMWPLVNNYGVSWVQDGSCTGPNYTGTCTGKAAWVQAVLHTAVTYGRGGTFWQGKTDMGSSYVEVGNEVYGSWYKWPDQGWLYPGQYAKMLEEAAAAVNSATNGRVKLVASTITDYCLPSLKNPDGSLNTNNCGLNGNGSWHNWAQDIKAAAPNIESEIGGIASHPYGDIAAIGVCNNNPCSTDPNWSHQQLYTLHSEWNVPIFVTEVGQKAASDSAGNGQVGYANQAAAMKYYFSELKNNPWEYGLFWYNQKDYQAYDPSADNGWALIDQNDNRKLAWNAYQTAALALENSSTSSSLAVSIASPSNGASVSGTTQINATVTDNSTVTSVQFELNGNNLGSAVTSSPYGYNWDTTKTANGSYTLTAQAKDATGNTVTSSSVTVTVNNSSSGGGGSAAGYHVSGNQIKDANNKVFEPHGVDVPTFIWSCGGIKSYNSDTGSSTFNTADFQTMKSKWGTNTIRLSVSQDLWLPGAQQGSSYSCSNTTYQQNIKNVVQAARSAGIVVLLDLHWSDQGNLSNPSNQQCMPDVNSETFWKSAASSFMNDSGVWFEIYNEPHPNNWSIWLNGGSVCGFTSVGMQQLVNTVRATGASNIIMAGGDGYASHLDGVPPLIGTNIGYIIHPYANPTNPSGYSTSDWNNRFGNLSATQAVIATEFGNPQTTGTSACSATASAPYTSAILSYFKQHNIGYTAWAYYDDYSKLNTSPGPCHFPVLLNPDGTCYANDGSCLIQADLQSYTSTGSGGGGGGTGGGGTPPYVQGFNFNASTKTLSWTAYPGAATYTIAEVHNPSTTRNTNYSWPHVAATSCVPGGSCNVPAPGPGETLHFGIIPLDSKGNAMAGTGSCAPSVCWAPEINVTWPKPTNTDTQAPTKPTNLLASSGSPYQINLTWTASKDNVGVAGYRIYRSKSGSLPVSVGTSTATSYGDTGLSPNTLYAYYVVAYDAANNKSSPSNNASTKTQASSTKTVTVEGVVSSKVSGKPIVDAFVKTGNYATPNGPVSAYTNRLGQYSLGGITPPTWQHYYFYSAKGYKTVTIHTILSAGINTQNVKLTP